MKWSARSTWSGRAASAETFPVRLVVHTDDRPGMLNQLTTILFDEHANIRSVEAQPDDGETCDAAVVEMTIEVRDKKQLERMVSAMRRHLRRARH